jgi:hypothetical protein
VRPEASGQLSESAAYLAWLMLCGGESVGDSELGGLTGIAAPIEYWRTKCKSTRPALFLT